MADLLEDYFQNVHTTVVADDGSVQPITKVVCVRKGRAADDYAFAYGVAGVYGWWEEGDEWWHKCYELALKRLNRGA